MVSYSGYQYTIPEVVYEVEPSVKDIGVDLFTGPRGSLAGTLPSWIAWFNPGHNYQTGSIVYFPGIYEKNIYTGANDGTYGEIHYIEGAKFETGRTEGLSKLVNRLEGDSNSGEVNARRAELGINETLKTSAYRNPYEGGDSTFAGASSSAGFTSDLSAPQGGLAYFEYGKHTLFVKIFGEGTNTLTNDSQLDDDSKFFDKQYRRKNGWYSFYELFGDENGNDPAGNTSLKIGFPPVNVLAGNWNTSDCCWNSNDTSNPYDEVTGSWSSKNSFREEKLSDPATNQSLNIAVSADQICLNACDKYAIYGIMQQSLIAADYVRFIVCNAILRSPDFGEMQDNDINVNKKERQIQLVPTDKVTFGGNILRSPKKVHADDMLNEEATSDISALESLKNALRNQDNGADEGITVLSAGYPAIIQPSAIFRDVKFDANDETITPIINPVTQSNFEDDNLSSLVTNKWKLKDNETASINTPGIIQDSAYQALPEADKIKYYSELHGQYNTFATENFNPSNDEVREASIMNTKIPMYDPRYGEARTSLNSFLTSLTNFAYPVSSSSSIPSWEQDRLYQAGEVVRMASNISDYNKPDEEDRLMKDTVWTCIVSHKSDSNQANGNPPSNAPPLVKPGESSTPSKISEMQNKYWRTYCIMANNPNTSLSSLKQLYSSAGVFPEGLNFLEAANQMLLFRDANGTILQTTDAASSPVQKKARIRMSDLIGGTRLYANLTICPAKEYDQKSFTVRSSGRFLGVISFGRRRGSTINFLNPPKATCLAQADLWLYASSFRKDHSGDIKFAVSFAAETNFVWATTLPKKRSWFSIVAMLGLCFLGILNPGFFLTASMQCTAWGFGGLAGMAVASGIAGAGLGLTLGVSAELIYGAIASKNVRKKMFTRKSFNQIVTTLKDDHRISVRRQNPQSQVRIDSDLLGDAPAQGEIFESNDNDIDSQPDIIRYSFDQLYPYMYYSKDGHTNFVQGEYKFYIQDLNSASITMSSFSYQDIFLRPSRSKQDALGNTFSGYPGSSNPAPISGHGDYGSSPHFGEVAPAGNWFGTADSHLWNQYNTLKRFVYTSNAGEAASDGKSQLISSQNYFNYLILGGESFSNPDDPLRALNIWSVDLEPSQFKSIIGMMQSGFRDLKLEDLETINSGGEVDSTAWKGLPDDYADYMTSNLPYIASLEANPGYELIHHDDQGVCSLTDKSDEDSCINANGIWTKKIIGLKRLSDNKKALLPTAPTGYGGVDKLDRAQVEILQKGFRAGEFQLGKHLGDHHSDFVSNLKNAQFFQNTNQGGLINWDGLNDSDKIEGGSILQKGGDYYFVRKTHKKGDGTLPT